MDRIEKPLTLNNFNIASECEKAYLFNNLSVDQFGTDLTFNNLTVLTTNEFNTDLTCNNSNVDEFGTDLTFNNSVMVEDGDNLMISHLDMSKDDNDLIITDGDGVNAPFNSVIIYEEIEQEEKQQNCSQCVKMLQLRENLNRNLKEIFRAMKILFSECFEKNLTVNYDYKNFTKYVKKIFQDGVDNASDFESHYSEMSSHIKHVSVILSENSNSNVQSNKMLISSKKKMLKQRLKTEDRLYAQEHSLLQEIINKKIKENEMLRDSLVAQQREVKCKESQIRTLKSKISCIIEEWRQKMETFRKEKLVEHNTAVSNKNIEIRHLQRDNESTKKCLEREQNRVKRLLKTCDGKEDKSEILLSQEKQIAVLKGNNFALKREIALKDKEREELVQALNDEKLKRKSPKLLQMNKKTRTRRHNRKMNVYAKKIRQVYYMKRIKDSHRLKTNSFKSEFFNSKITCEKNINTKAKTICGRKWIIHTVADYDLSHKIFDALQDYHRRLKYIEGNLPKLQQLLKILL